MKKKELKEMFPKGPDYPRQGDVHWTNPDGSIKQLVDGKFVTMHATKLDQIMYEGFQAIDAAIERVIAKYTDDRPRGIRKEVPPQLSFKNLTSDQADRYAEDYWAERLNPR